jgi:hypothetical protein
LGQPVGRGTHDSDLGEGSVEVQCRLGKSAGAEKKRAGRLRNRRLPRRILREFDGCDPTRCQPGG